MGDRGNVRVVQSQGEVWFYTHWTGSELKETVACALARGRSRWNDESYLARIIFCEMLDAGDLRGTTGFGISTYEVDNEHPVITVDCNTHGVEVGGKVSSFGEFLDKYATEEAKALPLGW